MSQTAVLTAQFADAVARGAVRVIDLTQELSPDTPTLVLPPNFGQCSGFKVEEISRYDERGVAWYWNNFTVSEHTGSHFDAPIHWVTGRDLPNNATDTIPPADFVAPAVVVDVSAQCAADPDYVLEPADLEAWEARHGRIPARSWVLQRTDWSKRTGARTPIAARTVRTRPARRPRPCASCSSAT
ncbi:MAG: cyclase family protein [Steroidobacteraceae bacterium]|jgi:kynurenine formamidase|nr:cyclase family protein [Steroidobacteraceae bacterium]